MNLLDYFSFFGEKITKNNNQILYTISFNEDFHEIDEFFTIFLYIRKLCNLYRNNEKKVSCECWIGLDENNKFTIFVKIKNI